MPACDGELANGGADDTKPHSPPVPPGCDNHGDDGWDGGFVDQRELIDFVRARGLGVIASRGPDGSPQAALVGIAATDRGEIVFDCSRRSRKYANIARDPAIALVVGWDDEVTLQIEGRAQILSGTDLQRCQAAYFEQHPDGRDRAASPRQAICALSRSGYATATTGPTRSAVPRRGSHRRVLEVAGGDPAAPNCSSVHSSYAGQAWAWS